MPRIFPPRSSHQKKAPLSLPLPRHSSRVGVVLLWSFGALLLLAVVFMIWFLASVLSYDGPPLSPVIDVSVAGIGGPVDPQPFFHC